MSSLRAYHRIVELADGSECRDIGSGAVENKEDLHLRSENLSETPDGFHCVPIVTVRVHMPRIDLVQGLHYFAVHSGVIVTAEPANVLAHILPMPFSYLMLDI